ncbi:carbonic anhydrase family protein [Weissella muntiaci]|uniref:Carbonic anhydrase n=1 Tax=Weissella muntiaci TaxID=2508881 RepID=A0A6C2C7Y4_9LACO|nr:carbonic anhydrase family protein [Weissella muntiaci]TYC50150.1 carbonic anhydrase family protein [Weissella muntiaci]
MQLDYSHQQNWHFESGQHQSPINIDDQSVIDWQRGSAIEIDYQNQVSEAHNSGNGLEVLVNGTAILNYRKFNLLQFHVHTPSEHQLNQHTFAAEVHFVHQALNGTKAVIGVFFELGAPDPVIDSIMQHWSKPGQFAIKLTDFIPADPAYYHYLGSLTTPPLTENVEWYIIKEPVTLSSEQLSFLQTLMPKNNRDLQAVNDRPILYRP